MLTMLPRVQNKEHSFRASTIRGVKSLVARMRWDNFYLFCYFVFLFFVILLFCYTHNSIYTQTAHNSEWFLLIGLLFLLLRSWWWTLTTEEAGSVWLTWSMRSLVPSSVLVIAFALLFVFECNVANMVNDKSDKGSRPVTKWMKFCSLQYYS